MYGIVIIIHDTPEANLNVYNASVDRPHKPRFISSSVSISRLFNANLFIPGIIAQKEATGENMIYPSSS